MLFPRISGVLGHDISLEMQFYLQGTQQDPYCIKRIDIYQNNVSEANKVAEIIISECGSTNYPLPLEKIEDSSGEIPGAYTYVWLVPKTLPAPQKYIDVWRFIGDEPTTDDDPEDEDTWQSQCGQFWLYPSNWYADDLLENVRYDFEPIELRFRKNERKTLDVGVIPTPLYMYNFNKSLTIIPHLRPTISISTLHNESIITDSPMEIGLRTGYYYDHPFVLKYMLDTSDLYIGTYKYRIKTILPNGETLISKDLYFTVA